MSLFQKKIGPVFLKEDSDASKFIEKMNRLKESVSDKKILNEIDKQIKLAAYGEIGEKNISFELKNSGLDMFVLHDIYLEIGDLSAQIDYIVVTRQFTFIIECKNLIGDIEIDSQGSFVRTYELFGKKVKEGIYSPITQNQRHLNVLKAIRKEAKGNFISKMFFEKYFDSNYKSLVVLANPKTCLNAKYAKSDVKNMVIRADKLVETIKNACKASTEMDMTEKEMREIAQFFLEANKSERSDYAKKYEDMVILCEHTTTENPDNSSVDIVVEETKEKTDNVETGEKICPKCGKPMVLRTASKGEHAGEKFYGCSGFPKCRHTEKLE